MTENKEVIKRPKVFLGGTCNGSTWRDKLIPLLKIDYFNPVVEKWTEECQLEEIKQRQECDFVLYVITSEMSGFYAIAEAIDDSNKRPEKTLFCILEIDNYTTQQRVSLLAISALIGINGGMILNSLDEIATFLNLQ